MKINKKKLFTRLIMLVIVIALIVGVIIVVINNNKKTANENKNESTENNILTENIPVASIDMNNLKNAKLEDGVKTNTSEEAHKDKEYSSFKFSDLTLASNENTTNFSVTITNKSDAKTEEQYVKVVCLDNDGNSMGELTLCISELEPGNSISASATTSFDYINLYNYKVEAEN